MSGTRSPSKTVPATESLWRLGLILWPFATAAVAVNLFLVGLLGLAVGLAAIPPRIALVASLPLGVPAAWVAARWVRGLIRRAEAGPAGLDGLNDGHD